MKSKRAKLQQNTYLMGILTFFSIFNLLTNIVLSNYDHKYTNSGEYININLRVNENLLEDLKDNHLYSNSNINETNDTFDDKVLALENFFDEYKSPLKNNAYTFVKVSEEYGMDYRILPAISCMESSCGKKMIPNSHNPFGWGIYGKNAIYFENFDEAIHTVGKGISQNYIAKGADTLEKIAPIYTPSNHIKWLSGVNFFINKIDLKHQEITKEKLSLNTKYNNEIALEHNIMEYNYSESSILLNKIYWNLD